MARLKFTANEIKKLKAPDPSGKQTVHWDTELKGFGIVCSGVTNSKSYIVQRDLAGGRTRRVTVGAVNVISLEQARKRAEEILAEFYRGIDPKKKRGLGTLRLALDEYLRARKDLRPSTVEDYRSSIKLHLDDWLDRPLASLSREMVEARHRAIQEKVAARGKNVSGHAAANQVMRVLRIIWNYAADRSPDLGPNPVKLKRQWYAVHRRTRMVPEARLADFYRAVDQLENQIARDYIKLLLFTGLRRNEAASLRWTDIDFESRMIRIPQERMKAGRAFELPMTDFVEALLRQRRQIGNETFVFPGQGKRGYFSEPKFIFEQINDATGIEVSSHDLRRNYMTAAESTELSPFALKLLVAHSTGKDVTAGYVQISPERLREAAQKVCDQIKRLVNVTAP